MSQANPRLMIMKVCPKCGVKKQSGEFSVDKRSPTGLQSHCKECKRAFYLANKDSIGNRVKANYRLNPEAKKAYIKSWQSKNRKLVNSYKQTWLQDHPDYNAEWKAINRDKVRNNENRRRTRKKANGVFLVSAKEATKLYSSPCFYCGATEKITLDHVIPISRGGTHSIGNLVPACLRCNTSKQAKTITEWKSISA